MNQYEPQIIWEVTRAAVSIAAWYVLFFRLHKPEQVWRQITLLIAMPAAYAFWIFMPMGVLGNAVSWAAITVVLAFICGDLRRSLFTAFFYIGMEASIDSTRCALVAILTGGFFPTYSPGYYLQYNLQYLIVFAASVYYYNVMKRFSGKPPLSSWLLTIVPSFGLWALLTYVAVVADPLLLEQGINIYGPGFCFGLFSIMCNMAVFYVHTRTLMLNNAQALTIMVSGAEPLWTSETGLSDRFIKKYKLSGREEEITNCIMQGKSNKEIAVITHIHFRTVENHLRNIYRKTGVSNRFALHTLISGQARGVRKPSREKSRPRPAGVPK